MMPAAVGDAVSFGVERSSGGQPPASRTPGSSGHVVERVEDVVVVAVGEELEADAQDAAERDRAPSSRPPIWIV